MNDQRERPGSSSDEPTITLNLLNAVGENSDLTQRSLAGELGIALGLTNAYLKRCIHKGYIKVTQAPANRYAYYLTPTGFSEKSRLTARYLSISFNFFRASREQCAEVFATCAENGWNRVLLAGAGDLGEIATLCVGKSRIELVGFIDPDLGEEEFSGLPVYRELSAAAPHDAVVITDLRAPQDAFDRLSRRMPGERILTPQLLNVSRFPPKAMP